MRVYMAGADGKDFLNILMDAGAHNVLVSYYNQSRGDFKWHAKRIRDEEKKRGTPVNLLLDSGGYTVRTRGGKVDVDAYAEFISDNLEHLKGGYFELDTNDADETRKNLKVLCDRGLKPIRIYHMSDYVWGNLRLLDEMLDEGRLFAIGGIAGVRGSAKYRKFFDYVFSKSWDKVPVHGLGITSYRLLKEYPWYSCDSTSWLSSAKFGGFHAFKHGKIRSSGYSEEFRLAACKTWDWRVRNGKEAEQWVKFEHFFSELWKSRGIAWD